jgi:hypothetical protein
VSAGAGGPGINNATTGQLTITGNLTATNSAHAVACTNQTGANVVLSGSLISSASGLAATNCAKFLMNPTPSTAFVRFAKNGTTTFSDFYTADHTGLGPAVGDVRAGVVYGSATGVLAVPPANSVAFGVAVDNTTGTAVLDPAAVASAVWGAASRTITGGLVDTATTLTNAPASVTPSDIWSHATRTITGGLVDTATTLTNAPTVPSVVQIRAEMDSNSTQLAAIKAKTDLLETTRLAQCSTVATTGDQIAAAFNSP